GIASHQSGVHFFHLFSHETKLRSAFRVNLVLVAEADRFERENRFAYLVHGLDLVLETLRGGCHAKLTVGVHLNRCACNRGPTNASDKGSCLVSACADADSVGLISNTFVADVDIEVARGKIDTGVTA